MDARASFGRDAAALMGTTLIHTLRYRSVHFACGDDHLLIQPRGWDGRVLYGERVVPIDFFEWMNWAEKEEYLMGRLRRLSEEEMKREATPVVSDADFVKTFPNLAEYMLTVAYEDGSVRKPSSLTIFAQDGQLKAVLKDPDNKRAMWATGDTWDGLLLTLDELLGSSDAVWRVDREVPGEQASRIKRR